MTLAIEKARSRKLHELIDSDDPRCFWCKQRVSLVGFGCANFATRDHILTRRRPDRKRGRGPKVLCCQFCNGKRGNMVVKLWARQWGIDVQTIWTRR